MANESIDQILGWKNLCGVIQGIKPGVPDVLPQAFRTLTKKVEGDAGSYTITEGVRKTAKHVIAGAPSVRVDMSGIKAKDVKLFNTFEQIALSPETYMMLRSFDSWQKQQMGKELLALQMRNFKQRFENLRISAIVSMLFLQHIYFDSAGNLLPTSSGNSIDIDFQVPAGNKGQLNVDGNGAIIAASWATSTTDIPLHLRTLKRASLRLTGYPLRYAFYGLNIPSYLAKNDLVKYYLARKPEGMPVNSQEILATGEIPNGLLGFQWIPAYEAFFEDANGTNQSFVGDDAIAFTPEITNEVYGLLQGTSPVPTSFQPTMDPQNPLADITIVEGQYSYGVATHDPVGAVVYAGDRFLPAWKLPNALFCADVTP